VFSIFEAYGVDNWRIVLVEVCPCGTKDELMSREAHFITTVDCVNKVIIRRTKAQWAPDNHERLSEARKQNTSDNPEKVFANLTNKCARGEIVLVCTEHDGFLG
jgi:hypothetical protein